MLANILDIVYESMRVSILHSRVALVLFDFDAAFLSFSHDFKWRMLRCLGVPDFVPVRFARFAMTTLMTLARCLPVFELQYGRGSQAGMPSFSSAACHL